MGHTCKNRWSAHLNGKERRMLQAVSRLPGDMQHCWAFDAAAACRILASSVTCWDWQIAGSLAGVVGSHWQEAGIQLHAALVSWCHQRLAKQRPGIHALGEDVLEQDGGSGSSMGGLGGRVALGCRLLVLSVLFASRPCGCPPAASPEPDTSQHSFMKSEAQSGHSRS